MKTVTTDVLPEGDYLEWHAGISRYGFWCIEIDDNCWNRKLNDIRSIYRSYLQKNYQRFPHVTIATVGLMDDKNWQVAHRQTRQLQGLKCNTIELFWSDVDSYKHSPIVRVSSLNDELVKVREALHSVSTGDDSDNYDPHITLGYYSKSTSIEIEQPADMDCGELKIKSILFCTYKTNSINSPISIEFKISLE